MHSLSLGLHIYFLLTCHSNAEPLSNSACNRNILQTIIFFASINAQTIAGATSRLSLQQMHWSCQLGKASRLEKSKLLLCS
jgi:hypothetical protein